MSGDPLVFDYSCDEHKYAAAFWPDDADIFYIRIYDKDGGFISRPYYINNPNWLDWLPAFTVPKDVQKYAEQLTKRLMYMRVVM